MHSFLQQSISATECLPEVTATTIDTSWEATAEMFYLCLQHQGNG